MTGKPSEISFLFLGNLLQEQLCNNYEKSQISNLKVIELPASYFGVNLLVA